MKTGLKKLVTAVMMSAALCAYGDEPDALSLSYQINTPVVTKRAVSPIKKYMEKVSASLSQHYSDVESVRNGQVVLVTLPCSELFLPNETTVRPNGEKYLRPFESLLKYPTMYKIIVAVHTDNTGDVQYRQTITEDRAAAIKEFWAKDTGRDCSDVLGYGLGNEDELVPDNSISNRARNRRVDIYIVPNDDMVKTASSGKLK